MVTGVCRETVLKGLANAHGIDNLLGTVSPAEAAKAHGTHLAPAQRSTTQNETRSLRVLETTGVASGQAQSGAIVGDTGLSQNENIIDNIALWSSGR